MNEPMPPAVNEHIEHLKFCIAGFNIDPGNYTALTPRQAGLEGDDSNIIYVADGKLPQNYTITFEEKAKNCRLFFEANVHGKGTKIGVKNEGNFLYIGKNALINKVSIVLLSKGDFVAVGEGVAVTSTCNWSTGFHPGKDNNGIIIGDHCLIGSEVAIRSSDGHSIFDLETREQVNIAHTPIIIEPYCWIGQRAAILKNVRIGACSILSFNAVVTKSCERFSALAGVPATARSIAGKMWLRNDSIEAKRVQAMYEERFAKAPAATVVMTE